MSFSFTADKRLMSQVSSVTCLPGWEDRSWCTSPPQQTKASCHRWLTYLSACLRRQELTQQTRGSCNRWPTYYCVWLRRQDLVYLSCTVDKRLMSQVLHLHVCLVEKAGAGVLLLHSWQEVHVTGGSVTCLPGWEGRSWCTSPSQQTKASCNRWLTYLSAWLRSQELVHFSSTVDKRFLSQVAHLPVCLVEKARAGVLLLHSRQEVHVTDGSVTCLPGWEGRSWCTSPPQ